MTQQPVISVEDAQLPLFVGIDVGGTSIKLGIVDDRGGTIGFTRVATEPRKPPQQAVARVTAAYQQLLARALWVEKLFSDYRPSR